MIGHYIYLTPILVYGLTACVLQEARSWTVLVGLVIGTATLRLLEVVWSINRLRYGEGRRRKFPPKFGSHPKSSPHWKLDESLQYEWGCVSEPKVYYQSFIPRNPKAILISIHGYADHSDYRMHEISHELALKGDMICVAIDQPSFGRSDGLWGYIPDWFQHVHVCAKAIKLIAKKLTKKEFSNLPIFAYGHSMGGGVVICLSVLYPSLFTGIVMTGPMCGLNPDLKYNPRIEKFFAFLAGWLPKLPLTPVPDLSRLCYKSGKFYRQERQKNRLAYPLKPRLGTALSMLEAQAWIGSNAKRVTIPFLILHGDTDLVTSSRSSLQFVENVGSHDKEFDLVKGGYHIMMGYGLEPAISKYVYKRVIEWIHQRI